MNKLVIIGIGNAADEIIDFVNRYSLFEIVGFAVNKKYLVDEYKGNPVYPVETFEEYVNKNTVLLYVAISYYNHMNKYKRAAFEELKTKGFHFANIISPYANMRGKSIGEGNFVSDCATIDFNATIGDNNYIGVGALIAHNSHIGSHNVLGGNCCVAGRVQIGNQCFCGVNSTIFDHLIIGDKCLIGGGVVVKRNVDSFTVVSVPDAIYKQSNEKYVELFLSLDALDITHNI